MNTVAIIFGVFVTVAVYLHRSEKQKQKANANRCYHCEKIDTLAHKHNSFYCNHCNKILEDNYVLRYYDKAYKVYFQSMQLKQEQRREEVAKLEREIKELEEECKREEQGTSNHQ